MSLAEFYRMMNNPHATLSTLHFPLSTITMPKDFNKDRPTEALQFRMPGKGQFRIESSEDKKKHAIKLVAFSGKPFTHWWWGDCVFDRQGAVIADKIAIDFNHNSNEGLGFLDTFEGDTELVCSGYLIPFKESDRASEILYKKEQGIPYQCSVMLDDAGFEYEYVKPGHSVEVNGETLDNENGLVIFRRYKIVGVAICLYGSDSNTTLFNKYKPLLKFEHEGEYSMPKDTDVKTGDDRSAREMALRFTKKFGQDRGFRYFTAGKSEEEAKDAFIEETSNDISEKDAKIAELEKSVTEKDEKIVELEKRLAELEAGEGETKPTGEEFRKLQEENKKFRAAAGLSGGEGEPLSGNESDNKPRKEFSPLPKYLQPLGKSFAKK
jgi:hypothetical protein